LGLAGAWGGEGVRFGWQALLGVDTSDPYMDRSRAARVPNPPTVDYLLPAACVVERWWCRVEKGVQVAMRTYASPGPPHLRRQVSGPLQASASGKGSVGPCVR